MVDSVDHSSNIKIGIRTALIQLRTAVPGIIDSFDPNTQLASVQPAISSVYTIDGEIKHVDLPILVNVHVRFQKSGGFVQTMPVNRGDECTIMVFDRDITQWYKKGGIQPPNTKRLHDMSSAYCVMGLSSEQNAITNFNTTDLEIRDDNGDNSISIKGAGGITVKSNKELLIESAANVVVKAPHVKLDATVVDIGGIDSVLHTHVSAAPGVNTSPPTLPAAPPPA